MIGEEVAEMIHKITGATVSSSGTTTSQSTIGLGQLNM